MSTFQLQQFAVVQDQSAMKVCTDALIFGAMATDCVNQRVLDIGAGTGLLSLICAQLGALAVTAVELCPRAAVEAQHNFAQSPWGERLHLVHASIQAFAADEAGTYDFIICNPPFFENQSKSAQSPRKMARHTDTLSYGDLLAAVHRLLDRDGVFELLIPSYAVPEIIGLAKQLDLHLHKYCALQSFAHSPAHVAVLHFAHSTPDQVQHSELVLYTQPRVYTAQAEAYLKSFLLRFVQV